MNEQQHNRISRMNFGEQLLGQHGNQFQMNNTWVPITPEKLILLRSNTVSDWPANQIRRLHHQEFPVPGSDYTKEMLMPYNGTDQNLHLIGGQRGHTGECNLFGGNLVNRNSVVNHTACSYTQPWQYENNGLNNNTLELLLKKNATSIANANMNFDASINMAARNPLLPNFYPQASSDVNDSYAGIQRWNNNSASDIAYREANRLLIPNRNTEFSSSNSNNFLNNDIHSSVPNQLNSIFSDIPYAFTGDSYHKHNLNYVPVLPIPEADAAASFTNYLQSVPETLDQLKFWENQMSDYTIVESTSRGKDLVSSTENEIQEYCDGLLQQIVESSTAVISPTLEDQQGSVSNTCDKGSDEGFDLNKTPGQKAPKRRKHRPKVIVEAKPKRNPKSASKKTKTKENPRKKRNKVPQTVATPKSDVIKETFDSTAATKKSCRKSLNFDLEKSGYESQSRTVVQEEFQNRNENAYNTTTSALLISQQGELTVENQQPKNTNDITTLLNEKVINPFLSARESTIALSTTTEGCQIAEFLVTEKALAQGNHNLCKERFKKKEIGNTVVQSETCCENAQKAGELIFQNTFHSVPNVLPNSTRAKRSKRKYSKSVEKKHYSERNPCGISLCQEILQVDENCNSTPLVKDFSPKGKRKRTQNRLPAKVCGRSHSQIMSKDDLQKVTMEEKNGFQPNYSNGGMPNCCIESCKFVEQQNNGTSTHDCFAISGQQHQINTILIDDIICQMNGLNLNESNISEMEGQKALVPYNGDGSIVLYQEFELAKKHKPRPKVDLDPETERTWKLLMGKEGSEDLEGPNKEREKWWEEERNVFRGRADSFIARMHLVQGDRRFSKWKGSVVDSVIGVFLTQNVSDHLSSSAFMSLAARFPVKSKSSRKTYDIVVTEPSVEVPELCIVNPADKIISYGRGTSNQPTYYLDFQMPHHTGELWRESETSRINESPIKPDNHSSEEELLSSQDSLDSTITQDTRIRSSSGYNSESEGLNSGYEPSKAEFLTSKNSLQIGKTTLFQEFYHSVNGVSLFEEQTKDGKLQQAEHVKQSFTGDGNDSHSFNSEFGHPSIYSHPQKQHLPVAPSTDHELHYSFTQGLNTSQRNGEEFSWPETVSAHGEFQDNSYRRFCIKEAGDIVDNSTEIQCGNGILGSPELLTVNPYGPLNKPSVLQGDAASRSHANYNQPSPNFHLVSQKTLQSESGTYAESSNTSRILGREQDDAENDTTNLIKHADDSFDSEKIISTATRKVCSDNSRAEPGAQNKVHTPETKDKESKLKVTKARKVKPETKKNHADDWDKLRKEVLENGTKKERSKDTMDSLDYEAIRCAPVEEISKAIRERGMNNMLAERMKEFLNRLVEDHGSIDLEWLREVPPDQTKDYLLSIRGLGLKSVECVRLLTLHHLAFPVDTNVGRIAVRLGWVPLQPLPEELQIHLLEMYPVLESVQKYLWPRLCKLDQRTLYELHYQMITFGKVFCTKKQPNCNACPMRAECRHFASAFASARLALPGPEEKRIVSMAVPIEAERNPSLNMNPMILPLPDSNLEKEVSHESGQYCEPIIEEPATPEQCTETVESDIEDFFYWEDPDELPKLDIDHQLLAENVQNCMQESGGDLSKAIVAWTSQSASIPTPKLKNVSRLRTEHQVYELPDSHPLLIKMDKREPDDPSPYLLAIWSPGETASSNEPPQSRCGSQDSTDLCNDKTCFSCSSIREADSQIVRGTLLIPCRTATRGSFPLNGTYFQVNELFADHASSIKPIDIPREWIWNLPRRTVYFGTSVTSIFKGLSTEEIQRCFWRGFVCVRGFDQQMRAPRPLQGRLHFKASRQAKTTN